MTERYRIDPGRSQFAVQAFAAGPLSFFAHSPRFAVPDFAGSLDFEGGAVKGLALELTVNAGALVLLDRVGAADRREIEERMRRDVLETSAFPEIAFRSTEVAEESGDRGRYRLRIDGRLSLHGVTLPHPIDADLLIFEDAVQLRGGGTLRMSDHRIKPVTALAGAIQLKDEVRLSFDLVAFPEGP